MEDIKLKKCSNCDKEIEEAKFFLHERMCVNIHKRCECGEVVEIELMEEHQKEYHIKYPCKHCKSKFLKKELDSHETSCNHQLKACQYCDLQISLGELKSHENVCGSKTEVCGICGNSIMMKIIEKHYLECSKNKHNMELKDKENKRKIELNQNTKSVVKSEEVKEKKETNSEIKNRNSIKNTPDLTKSKNLKVDPKVNNINSQIQSSVFDNAHSILQNQIDEYQFFEKPSENMLKSTNKFGGKASDIQNKDTKTKPGISNSKFIDAQNTITNQVSEYKRMSKPEENLIKPPNKISQNQRYSEKPTNKDSKINNPSIFQNIGKEAIRPQVSYNENKPLKNQNRFDLHNDPKFNKNDDIKVNKPLTNNSNIIKPGQFQNSIDTLKNQIADYKNIETPSQNKENIGNIYKLDDQKSKKTQGYSNEKNLHNKNQKVEKFQEPSFLTGIKETKPQTIRPVDTNFINQEIMKELQAQDDERLARELENEFLENPHNNDEEYAKKLQEEFYLNQ